MCPLFDRRAAGVVPRRMSSSNRSSGAIAAVLAVSLLSGCSDDTEPLVAPSLDPVSSERVDANPHNVLALDVGFTASGVDVARVRYRIGNGARDDAARGDDETTPFVSVENGDVSLPVLGLLPETDYELEIEAITSLGSVTTSTMALPTTGSTTTVTTSATTVSRPTSPTSNSSLVCDDCR